MGIAGLPGGIDTWTQFFKGPWGYDEFYFRYVKLEMLSQVEKSSRQLKVYVWGVMDK